MSVFGVFLVRIFTHLDQKNSEYGHFSGSTIHYTYYITDMVKKLEVCLLLVLILVKIKFRQGQISMPKIGTPMSIAVCIDPWLYLLGGPRDRFHIRCNIRI